MNNRLVYLLSLLILMLSCGKESEEIFPAPAEITSCKILQTKGSDNGLITTYQYDDQGLLKKVDAVFPNTSQNANYYEMEYDASGKLIKTTWNIPSTNSYLQVLYDYNNTGQLSRWSLNFRNAEGNYVPGTYYLYEYNSPDELKQRRLYSVNDGEHTLLHTEDFFYENGLMTKVDLKGQYEHLNKVFLLEYDDKNNHAYQSRVFTMQGYGYPFKHNITKETTLNYKGQVISDESYTITYTYNQQYYPVTSTYLSQSNRKREVTYSYSCK
jgi:YD repeat-containing protein